MACVPATIATFVEVAGTADTVCFRADTGYNSCLNIHEDSPNGKSACPADGV
ncbi:14806_t:CDS:2, partial [Funneliformis geosporum]